MFLKELKLLGDIGIIREIQFHNGLNLIVDETIPLGEDSKADHVQSGNSVGKTTVLKLINFCLGGSYKEVYTDPENPKNEDRIVKAFLEEHHVQVLLCLKQNLDVKASDEIIIERNFLARKNKIAKINDTNYLNEKEFETKLRELLYPDLQGERPSLAQLIANNIRYKDIRINNTINNLHPNTQRFDYEALYLYMLGCPMDIGKQKLELQEKIKQEKSFLKKLEQSQSKNAYAYALTATLNDIEETKRKKEKLNINDNFQHDLQQLDETKTSIGLLGSSITNYEIRLDYIKNGIQLIEEDNIDINMDELQYLYDDVKANIGAVHHTFEELVQYHETMLLERKALLLKEYSDIKQLITTSKNELALLLEQERVLSDLVKKSNTLDDLDAINGELNQLYQKVGEYKNNISQIDESEARLNEYEKEIEQLEDNAYSDEAIARVKEHVERFDQYFAKYSKELYDEPYHLKHEIKVTKNGQKYYQFDTFSMAISTGKKQGEALAFDLAYIDYAQNEHIHHLDFLLNDKKELMDINQIIKVTKILERNHIQLVCSILQDKLPKSLNNEAYVVLRLSQENKLFQIEKINERYRNS